jgi:drug/metabolite transporter (DMT)-like permease
MIYYLYIFVIPLLIAFAGYFIEGKPSKSREWVNFLFNVFKNYIFYALLLYYVGGEHFINVGLSFISVLFFTIPLGIVIIPLKVYYFFKKEK